MQDLLKTSCEGCGEPFTQRDLETNVAEVYNPHDATDGTYIMHWDPCATKRGLEVA